MSKEMKKIDLIKIDLIQNGIDPELLHTERAKKMHLTHMLIEKDLERYQQSNQIMHEFNNPHLEDSQRKAKKFLDQWNESKKLGADKITKNFKDIMSMDEKQEFNNKLLNKIEQVLLQLQEYKTNFSSYPESSDETRRGLDTLSNIINRLFLLKPSPGPLDEDFSKTHERCVSLLNKLTSDLAKKNSGQDKIKRAKQTETQLPSISSSSSSSSSSLSSLSEKISVSKKNYASHKAKRKAKRKEAKKKEKNRNISFRAVDSEQGSGEGSKNDQTPPKNDEELNDNLSTSKSSLQLEQTMLPSDIIISNQNKYAKSSAPASHEGSEKKNKSSQKSFFWRKRQPTQDNLKINDKMEFSEKIEKTYYPDGKISESVTRNMSISRSYESTKHNPNFIPLTVITPVLNVTEFSMLSSRGLACLESVRLATRELATLIAVMDPESRDTVTLPKYYDHVSSFTDYISSLISSEPFYLEENTYFADPKPIADILIEFWDMHENFANLFKGSENWDNCIILRTQIVQRMQKILPPAGHWIQRKTLHLVEKGYGSALLPPQARSVDTQEIPKIRTSIASSNLWNSQPTKAETSTPEQETIENSYS